MVILSFLNLFVRIEFEYFPTFFEMCGLRKAGKPLGS